MKNKIYAVKVNNGITNHFGSNLFFCEEIKSGDYVFYKTIENDLNKHYLTFTEKEVIDKRLIDIKF
jgi:hypothetical protein